MDSGNGHQAASADRQRTRTELEVKKALLVTDPETGRPDWLKYQARCIAAVGSAAGVLLRELTHLTGLSALEDGWLWNPREAWRERPGLGNRELEKARAILRGDKPWAGRTVKVLEERRPSRRAPVEYRLDMPALAALLGVKMPHADEGSDSDLDDFGGLFEDEGLEDDAPESPPGATESPHGATKSPRGATESPPGTATEETYRGSAEVHAEDPPTGGADGSRRPAPRHERDQRVGLDDLSSDSDLSAARELLADPDTAPGRLVRAMGKGDGRGGSVDANHVALALSRALHEGNEDEAPRYMGLVGIFADDLAKETNGRLERSVG